MNLVNLKKSNELFLIIGIDLKNESLTMETCKDDNDRDFKINMFRKDFGPEWIFLPYPDAMSDYGNVIFNISNNN